VYGPTPPDAVAVASPVKLPLQRIFVEPVIATEGVVAPTTATVPCEVQLFASVTVTVYVPPVRLDSVDPVPPDGAHKYVYGPTPPETITSAVPFGAPHVDGVEDSTRLSAVGAVSVNICCVVHPLKSVIVHV
jgi:hypothetical protein